LLLFQGLSEIVRNFSCNLQGRQMIQEIGLFSRTHCSIEQHSEREVKGFRTEGGRAQDFPELSVLVG
jgi:hypothetical protein